MTRRIDASCGMLRDWGAETKYKHVLHGFNYRMEGIQGAVLRVKLRHLGAGPRQGALVPQQYDSLLANAGVVTPEARADARHVYHLYVVRSSRPVGMAACAGRPGMATGIHYPTPVHLLPAFAGLGHRRGDFPHSECSADQVLSLPMYPELTKQQVEPSRRSVPDLCKASVEPA